MKLSDLEAILVKIKEARPGEDVDILFTNYSERSFPLLDWEGFCLPAVFKPERHTHTSGSFLGAVSLPLGRIS